MQVEAAKWGKGSDGLNCWRGFIKQQESEHSCGCCLWDGFSSTVSLMLKLIQVTDTHLLVQGWVRDAVCWETFSSASEPF